MTRKILIITAMLIVVCSAGCTRVVVTEGGAPGVRVDDARAPGAGMRLNSVTILDDSLEKWTGREGSRWSKVAVESTNSRRTPTGTLEVWGVLRNRTDHPLQLEGRALFFDTYQVPIEGPTAWQLVILPPNSVGAFKEFSTQTSTVAYYRIEIREGR